MSNAFKAPQKSLRTSFPSMIFSKPKKGKIVVKRSYGSSRQVPLIKSMGLVVSGNFSDTTY